MPKVTSHAPGTPNWVDLSTPDPDASRRFYHALFGWDYTEEPTGGEPYIMARIDGASAAGMMRQDPAQAAQGVPPMWNMYIAVSDVAAATAAAEAHGARVVMPPMQVMDSGSMSVLFDPVGAAVGLWQPAQHIGCEVVNEHGAFTWSEVVTDAPEKLDGFYGPVVGARFAQTEFGGQPYTMMSVEGRGVGGSMRPQAPGTPPHWHVYFHVDDADAACQAATAHGGTVVAGPMDTPAGRMATLRDPHGAVFSVIQAG